ncbi:GlcG/HbpS family heme-binding protein [Enemella sp. A6]|uniref:GlcG/HbpS family heme-binding protein n=1 Tax=Enemella sp. A6 TaxID=3440152 RepID=UPI003EB9F48B
MSDYVRSRNHLTLDGARIALAAAAKKSAEMGLAVNVAIADTGGHLLAFERHDGAFPMSAQVAQDKAYSVAILGGAPTHLFYEAIKDDAAVREGIVHQHRLIAFGGGLPIMIDGEFVGTIGVSGGTAEEDRQIAEAGAAALA